MAEKRMLSKVISISEKVNSLPDVFDMLLYTWMIPHTDDFGRMFGSPAKVKALVVPMHDKTSKDVEQSIRNLHIAGVIEWYEVNGDMFIQVNNFEEHQSGLHKRTKSKFPEPPSTQRQLPDDSDDIPGTSGKVREIPPELKGREGKGTEQEEKGIGTEGSHPPLGASEEQTLITEWCKKYNVEIIGYKQLENLDSFIGVMDMECIHYAIQQAENKQASYAVSVMQRLVREGKIKKEDVSIVPEYRGEDVKRHAEHGGSAEGNRSGGTTAPSEGSITGGQTGWIGKERVIKKHNLSVP